MLRMIDRHAVQQMLTARGRSGEVARHFAVSRRTIEQIRKEPAVEGSEDAVARWKRGVGRPPVPATVRERMRALIAEDSEAPPLEVLRRLREEGRRLGESTFSRLHRAEREGLPKELMARYEGVAAPDQMRGPRRRVDDARARRRYGAGVPPGTGRTPSWTRRP